MGESKRWSVMYTKHVRQKRKVYQDGYLELQSTGNKVILYDEYDTLLESRFAKKDDAIKSGGTLTFDSYLVNIINHCGENKPMASLNSQDKHEKFKEEFGSSHDIKSPKMTPSFGKNKARVTRLSPSQKIIREFKKNESNKCVSSSSSLGCLGVIKSIKTGWQVLYTTQMTQKVKKFHDGFLQLIVSGSQGRQVVLYDDTRRHLDSRFLKKSELVNSGESLAFDGHLVDIGELERNHISPINPYLEGGNKKIVGQSDNFNSEAQVATIEKFHAGKIQHSSWRKCTDFSSSTSDVDERNLSLGMPTYERRRAVQEILSVLKKPIILVEFSAQNKKLVEEHLDLHSEDVHNHTEPHINKSIQNKPKCVEDELDERVVADDCSFKVFKSEAVEILNESESCSVSESDRESHPIPVCLRSAGAADYTIASANVNDYSVCNNIKQVPTSVPLSTASRIKSNRSVELENSPQISLCKEQAGKTTDASANDLRSNMPPKVKYGTPYRPSKEACNIVGEGASGFGFVASNDGALDDVEKTPKQDFKINETYEFPTFDLGL